MPDKLAKDQTVFWKLMRVVSVNIASVTEDTSQLFRSKVKTGIYKKPQSGRVKIDFLGLEGDVICNSKHHGGADQAVYAYSMEDYKFWSRSLNSLLEPGAFGENLTISGIDFSDLCIGDFLVLPDLQLQATAPRIPCRTLSSAIKQKNFSDKFNKANRPGAYFRVILEGTVGEGDEVKLKNYNDGARVTLAKFFRDKGTNLGRKELERYLRLPIDKRSRKKFENRLRKFE